MTLLTDIPIPSKVPIVDLAFKSVAESQLRKGLERFLGRSSKVKQRDIVAFRILLIEVL